MARPEKIRLGELLVKQGLMTPAQLDEALAQQKQDGRKLGRVIVESGYVTEADIAQALANQLRVPYIDLKNFTVDKEVARQLPETHARRFRAVALEDRGHALLVGLADPTDLSAYDQLTRLVRREIELAVVVESLLVTALDHIYSPSGAITGLAQELQKELADQVVDFGAADASQSLEEAPVVKLLQTMFEDAIRLRASDIHIEPQETRLQVRYRIDGMLHLHMEADLQIAAAVVRRLKLIAGLDISERRLPQDGRFNAKLRQGALDARISTLPTQYGESVVLRLLGTGGARASLDEIGLPPAILRRVRAILEQPHGMLLVTGPTGSGKTTTLYAALAELNRVDRKLITVEDPVEYRLPGINQVQINEKVDLTFSRVLRAALRQDPDVILVGEMRDAETAQIGLRAAITGHLVLSTLHTNDAGSTPIRLMDMDVPGYMVGMALRGVLAQRLVRTICPHCTAPYTPSPGEVEWLRLELGNQADSATLAHGTGCTLCNGTGYQHRVGVFEFLEMTPALIRAVNDPDPNHFIHEARQSMAGATLRQDAVRMVVQGKTTVYEAMRVSAQHEE